MPPLFAPIPPPLRFRFIYRVRRLPRLVRGQPAAKCGKMGSRMQGFTCLGTRPDAAGAMTVARMGLAGMAQPTAAHGGAFICRGRRPSCPRVTMRYTPTYPVS